MTESAFPAPWRSLQPLPRKPPAIALLRGSHLRRRPHRPARRVARACELRGDAPLRRTAVSTPWMPGRQPPARVRLPLGWLPRLALPRELTEPSDSRADDANPRRPELSPRPPPLAYDSPRPVLVRSSPGRRVSATPNRPTQRDPLAGGGVSRPSADRPPRRGDVHPADARSPADDSRLPETRGASAIRPPPGARPPSGVAPNSRPADHLQSPYPG